MIITKRLDTPELIEDACALLYKEYIENGSWVFSSENPSELKVVTKNNRKLLIDRITQHAVWFGAFDNNKLVGCIRLFKATERIPFEIETYPTAKKIVEQYIEVNKPNIYEGSRACVDFAYKGENILTLLYLAISEYCQGEKASVFGSASNGYLKSVLRQIEWPCKKEEAFKFEETDYAPVNFYLASYENAEVSHMIEKIKSLKNMKDQKSINIFDALNVVAPIFPAAMYWHDTKGVVLGINAQCLKVMDKSRDEVLGKTPYDFYAKEIADHIWEHSKKVIESGETLSHEEYIYDASGKCIGIYLAIKAPLYDENGHVIGIVGTSIDLTAEKEAEQLKIENEKKTALLEEKERFAKIANQVAHDIRSPLMSLSMIVKTCTDISESKRIALREAATGIGDIANHLLDKYKQNEAASTEVEERKAILVPTILLELLTSKKYQHKQLPTKFNCHFEDPAQFIFIKTQPSAFKRMLSNLMNNAVDALDGGSGAVNLHLSANPEWVQITIQDTGKGMSPELIAKIMNKTAVTEGKKDGHGIGLTQVWDTLDTNQGEMTIVSQPRQGTTIILSFPRVKVPSWIAEEIVLNENDFIIILDDDTSIHGAWQTRFETILDKKGGITRKHFENGQEALNFINSLSPEDKSKVFLLSDYELLKQELNGLHVIEKSGVERSVLVTSHYADPLLQEKAVRAGTKILPKQLASDVSIKIAGVEEIGVNDDIANSRVEIVLVEDDEDFLDSIVNNIFCDKIVDQYLRPEDLFKNIHRYSKDTKIYLDNKYNNSWLNGVDVAKELHEKGYEQLYLLSGSEFSKGELPSYLKTILKGDMDGLERSKNEDNGINREKQQEQEELYAVIVDDNESFVKALQFGGFGERLTEAYHSPEDLFKNIDKYPKDTRIFVDNNFVCSELKGVDVAEKLHDMGYTRLYILSGEPYW